MIKGSIAEIIISNVNGATVANVVTDVKGGVHENLIVKVSGYVDEETNKTIGMYVAVQSATTGTRVSGSWALPPHQQIMKRPREVDFLERIEKKVDDAVAKVGIDALQAYYATDEFKIKVQEAVAAKVKELEPEIRKRIRQ